jgi:hypothetical protein
MARSAKNNKHERAPAELMIAIEIARLSRIGSSASDELLFEELLPPVEGTGVPIGAGTGTGAGMGTG